MTHPNMYTTQFKLDPGTHTSRINQLLVTPDNKRLITIGGGKSIRLWDIETRKQAGMLLGQVGNGADGAIQAIALSRDGKYVLALAWLVLPESQEADDRETELRVYELATGNLQAGYRYPGALQDLDFSPDDRYLALVANPRQTNRRGFVVVHDSKKILEGFGRMPAPLAEEALYKGDSLVHASVRFVPGDAVKSREYRLVTATHIRDHGAESEFRGRLSWYSFLPSGELKKTGLSHDTEKGFAPESLAVSREFAIITGPADVKKFYCYDHEGRLTSQIHSESAPAQPAFSKDGTQLIVGQRGDSALVQVKLYNTSFGQFELKSTYFGHDSEVVATALLADGTAVSAGGDQNAIHLWNPSHIDGEQIGVISGVGRVIHAVGMRSNEQIGIGMRDDLRLDDQSIVMQRVFDLGSMTLKSLSFQEMAQFRRAQKTHDGQRLEWLKQGGNLKLFLQPDNIHLSGVDSVESEIPVTFGFTERGSIVTGWSDGNVRIALRVTGGGYKFTERLLVGHEARVLDHAVSEKWLVTAGADQVIRMWYLEDVERDDPKPLYPAMNLFVGSDDEWVMWSQNGYYNASQRGDRRFGYHVNRGAKKEALFFSSDRFIKAFFRPDIIRTILETGSEERAIAKLKAQGVSAESVDVSRILPPIVELTRNGITQAKNKVTFKFSVEELDPENQVTRVWIVRNDQFAWESRKRAKRYNVSLPLSPGRNRFKIIAETETTKSMPVIQVVMGAVLKPGQSAQPGRKAAGSLGEGGATRGSKAPVSGSQLGRSTLLKSQDNGKLFLLAVGVSEFKDTNSGIKFLTYADNDAVSMYNAFGRADLSGTSDPNAKRGVSKTIITKLKNKAFDYVEATILTNTFAKKKSILDEISRISAEIKRRSESRNSKRDALLVFLSGHGILSGDGSNLYFWNYDAVLENLEKTGLSFMELGKKITSIPAEVVLATDACHSGMAGSGIFRGVDPNELAKRIYAINERGLYILNAARSEEFAQEHEKISHGVFTRSILDALEADSETDMSMMKLMDSVQRHVRKWAGDKQTPVFRAYGDLLPLTIYSK